MLSFWACDRRQRLTTKDNKVHKAKTAKKNLCGSSCPLWLFVLQALTTLPLRRQEVQTRMRLAPPFTLARTGRRLTFQRRRDTLCAWLMVFPNCGPLPQISQTCAMTTPERFRTSRRIDFTGVKLISANAGL